VRAAPIPAGIPIASVRILLVSPAPPVATKPRPHHFLRGLAARGHEVHLLAEWPGDPSELSEAPGWREVEVAAASVTWVRVPRSRSLLQSLASLPTPTPLRVAYCRSPHLIARAESLIRRHGIQVLHVDRERLAPAFGHLHVPKVLDATDSITLYLRRVLRHGPLGERAVAALELPKMPRFERRMAEGYHACVVTTEADAATLREAGSRARIEVLGNGVDGRFLDAPRVPASGLLVFVGTMSYAPNVDAAAWFARRVLPAVRAAHPGARLRLVGHRPARAVRGLASLPGVEVTGTVPDVLPALQGAAVFVAPIRIGGGFSNKLAEALAAAVPAVATPAARVALPGAVPGLHLLEAEAPPDFAGAVARLLADPALASGLGEAGRVLVRERHTWTAAVTRLEAILEAAAAAG
jgi:glycosyltransferase involved in cell wall biosynthesis